MVETKLLGWNSMGILKVKKVCERNVLLPDKLHSNVYGEIPT